MQKYTACVQHAVPAMSEGVHDIYLAADVEAMRATFDAAADLHAQIVADKNASIAALEREIAAITGQRDRVWSQLLEARERIQALTFGSRPSN